MSRPTPSQPAPGGDPQERVAPQRTARRREHGQVLVVFAFSMMAMIAMAGLLIDGGRAWQDRRQAQIAADTGALAAGQVYAKGGNDATARAEAQSIAASNGFSAATACDGTSLTSGTQVNGVSVTKPASDTVKVSVTRPLRTTFAAAIGQGCWMVSAQAVARYSGASVAGPTVLASRRTCPTGDTIKWSGHRITIMGGVHSNGGIDANDDAGSVTNGTATYTNPPGCTNTVDPGGLVPPPSAVTTFADYPISYTAADFPCTFTMTIERIDGLLGPYWLDEAARILKPGVYCRAGGSIKVGTRYTTGNVTLVANAVAISAADVNFTPYVNGVFIFAEGSGSKAINLSGSNATWEGLIFAPNGEIHLTGAAAAVVKGNVWGRVIDLGGDDWTIEGAIPGTINPLELVLVE